MQHVFITGGAGFICQALMKRFLERGLRVPIFDSPMRNAMQYFEEPQAVGRLNIIRGDARALPAPKAAVGDAGDSSRGDCRRLWCAGVPVIEDAAL